MPEPLPRIEQLARVASEALTRRDWSSLRFNAKLMCEEAPDNPAAWSYLGIALFQQGVEQQNEGLVRQAIDCHRTAVQHGPNDSMAVANLGFALNRLRRYKDALAVLAPATDHFPDHPHILAHRAQAELGLNEIAAAGASVERILGLVREIDEPILTIFHLYLSDQTVPLLRPLDIAVHRVEEGYVCEENDFDLYGTGDSFKDALIDLCEYFVTLVEEYVYTKDPLDQGAQKIAVRLREHIGPDFTARLAERAS